MRCQLPSPLFVLHWLEAIELAGHTDAQRDATHQGTRRMPQCVKSNAERRHPRVGFPSSSTLPWNVGVHVSNRSVVDAPIRLPVAPARRFVLGALSPWRHAPCSWRACVSQLVSDLTSCMLYAAPPPF